MSFKCLKIFTSVLIHNFSIRPIGSPGLKSLYIYNINNNYNND